MTADREDPFRLMTLPAPAVEQDRLAAFIVERFGLKGDLKPLVSERDQNFRLTTDDGSRYVVKIYNPGESPDVLDFQARALEHVAAQAPELPVPHIVPAKSGAALQQIDTPSGESLVRIVTWLEGTPIDDMPRTRALRRNLATTMAELGLALRGYFHPAARHPLLWDVRQARAAATLVEHIEDPARRALAQENFERHARRVAPLLPNLRAQVIHNDCNPDNVLADAAAQTHIAGIIDFGDMVHAPLINDLAVAIAYQVVGEPAPLEVACDLIRAYHPVCPLEAAELDVLYDLVVLRLTMSVAICTWRARRHPGNVDYILGNNDLTWQALDQLAGIDRRSASEAFRRACVQGSQAQAAAKPTEAEEARLHKRRRNLLGPSLSLSYDEPLHIVRGEGAWLYDARGRAYLDAYNNVACVGHTHPVVVEAIATQARRLNTNTRYLHENIVDYAERLTARLPGDLSVCFFVCTGSEANDLAWQIACAVTGGDGAIVTEHAYHGNTTAVAQLSPEELGPGKQEDWIGTVPAPDRYRHPGAAEADAGEAMAADLDDTIEALATRGRRVAAFFVDTIYTSDGIHLAPPGYLDGAWRRVRSAGGLCVADEVQPGFGRTGSHFWGFEQQGVVPDIVTLGKPMGNGHPLAAVVTTPAIAEKFAAERYYFNTFGGNPVSCAAGLAVLDVLEREDLQGNARETGRYLQQCLNDVASRHALVGDVRGDGLFYGIELVNDPDTREPAAETARTVMNGLRRRGVLIGRTGRHGNVLKIRPPLVFSREHADRLAAELDGELGSMRSPPAGDRA